MPDSSSHGEASNIENGFIRLREKKQSLHRLAGVPSSCQSMAPVVFNSVGRRSGHACKTSNLDMQNCKTRCGSPFGNS